MGRAKGKVDWCFNVNDEIDRKMRVMATESGRTVTSQIEIVCRAGFKAIEEQQNARI